MLLEKAKKDLNILIGKDVMGWKLRDGQWIGDPKERGTSSFQPSENIADAWEVVGYLQKNWWVTLVCIENRLYDVLLESFWRDVPNVRVRKNTMPLAICYAALKAIKETERLEGGSNAGC